jgi:hypothetical protein
MRQRHARRHGQRLVPIVKADDKLPGGTVNIRSPLSCFRRWSDPGPDGAVTGEIQSLKIEARCKQCGQAFVKYAYERTSRCEACRKGSANKLPCRGITRER